MLNKRINSAKTKEVVIEPECIIGQSAVFLAALDIAKKVSGSAASVLLTGESGTGKEIFAHFIHNNSKRCNGPFVALNCSSIPENLLESELFGHAKGSFTGAFEKRIGLFEAAEDGTLFLDEICDLSAPLQAKLLRVLQERKIKRVGENEEIDVNCRIISATHKDLTAEVKDGHFREDLFFRLNVIPIRIPPLRDRHGDLLLLAKSFLKKFALENCSDVTSFSGAAIKFLSDKKWFGNVRELENIVERAVVLCSGSEIQLENFLPLCNAELTIESCSLDLDTSENIFVYKYQSHLPTLDAVINRYISFAVDKNGGAKDSTAKIIGIDRKTLYKRMQRVDAYEATSSYQTTYQ